MNGTLNLKLGNKITRCFINSGSFNSFALSAYHKHSYAEVHIIFGGKASYYIGKTLIHAGTGSVIYIPAGIYHCACASSGNVYHSAFQLDSSCMVPCHRKLPEPIISGYFDELEKSNSSNNYSRLSTYISLLCSNVIGDLYESIEGNSDYAYTINEYFAKHYNKDITVSDLAHYLGLSEKQTTRLVKKHTQKTFLQNLVETRMLAADYLSSNTNMPMADIAQYVGYKSYGGFFKAREKYMAEYNSKQKLP